MISNAYEQGYYASASDDLKSDNPYSSITQAMNFYSWLAGFNDFELGYDLDLTVLN